MENLMSGAILSEDGDASVPVIAHTHVSILSGDGDLSGEQQFTEA
jgi:hypothetical protein